jgi:hypothetical protein
VRWCEARRGARGGRGGGGGGGKGSAWLRREGGKEGGRKGGREMVSRFLLGLRVWEFRVRVFWGSYL